MKRMIFPILFFCTLIACCATDSEMLLHKESMRKTEWMLLGLKYHSLHQSGQIDKLKDPMVYYKQFIRRYPGTKEAHLAAIAIMREAFKKGDMENFFPCVRRLLPNTLEDGRLEALSFLIRIANNPKNKSEVRENAASLALSHCEGNGLVIRGLYNCFLKNRMSWKELCELVLHTGKNEPMAMETLSFELGDSHEKRKDFERIYGTLFLPPLPKKLAKERALALADILEIEKAVKAKGYSKALSIVECWKKYSPWSIRDPLVKLAQVIGHSLPDAEARKFAAFVFSFGLPGETCKNWLNIAILSRQSSFAPENEKEVSELLHTYIARTPGKAELLHTLRFMRSRKFPGLATLAKAASEAGFGSYASELLFEAAREIWDSNLGKAEKYLKDAIRAAPDSAGAIQSLWWLERMTGKVSFDAGAAARLPEFLRHSFQPLPFPKYVGSASSPATLKGAPASLKPQLSEAFRKWVPKKLPDSKILTFQNPVSLSEIQVKAEEGLFFTIELADQKGKILRVLERSWPFVILGNANTYQPDEVNIFKFLPLDGVAFARITVFSRVDDKDGITSVQFLSPPFPIRSIYRDMEKNVPPNAKVLKLTIAANEPTGKVVYKAMSEDLRVTPHSRWYNPWKSHRRAGNTTLGFYAGDFAEVSATRGGILNFAIDGIPVYAWRKERSGVETISLPVEGNGFRRLSVFTSSFPKKDGEHVPDSAQFLSLTVTGKARAIAGAEFFVKGHWTAFIEGTCIDIPSGSEKVRPCILFDSSAIAGKKTAQIIRFQTQFLSTSGEEWNIPASLFSPEPPDAATSALNFLAEKRPAIVYSKTGTPKEYETARKLAEYAGCYLVSDDAALNNEGYRGPYLVIGTLEGNRFCRQAGARLCLWNSPSFLNNATGCVFKVPEFGNEEAFYAVSGKTSSAVVLAAERILKSVRKYHSELTFRLFKQSLFERLMPWQLHPEKGPLDKLTLTMARNERRNTCFGIVFEQKADCFSVKCSDLVSGGKKLSSPEIRFVGFHEYIDFYGDLHQPDLLFDKPRLPIPANSSQLVLLTCRVPANASPGNYSGTIEVDVNGNKKKIPFFLLVVPGTIQEGNLQFNDYAVMPYYYHDTDRMRRDRKNLLRNQALHGISMIIVKVPLCGKKTSSGTFFFDFKNLEEYLSDMDTVYRAEGKKLPWVFFPVPDNDLHKLAHAAKTPYEIVARVYAESLKKYLASHPEVEKRFYCSLGDEVLRILESWIAKAKIYHDAGLKIFVTHAHPKMRGIVSAWCPNYAHKLFDEPYLAEALRKGKEPVWWYSCAGGGPNNRFTGNPVDFFPLYLLTVKWGVSGAFNNAALHTTESAYPVPYRFDHGSDTRIFFLPDGTLHDTLRREFEAEGIQDALLLYSLRKNQEIMALLREILPSKWQYSRDPDVYEKLRMKAYSLLK